METVVEALKKEINFKDKTEIGDIVLIMSDHPKHSVMYAVVKDFELDDSRRDEWWFVTLQLLVVPIYQVKWTLRREQFTGQEIFTMGGVKKFIKAVDMDTVSSVPPGDNPKDVTERPKLHLVK